MRFLKYKKKLLLLCPNGSPRTQHFRGDLLYLISANSLFFLNAAASSEGRREWSRATRQLRSSWARHHSVKRSSMCALRAAGTKSKGSGAGQACRRNTQRAPSGRLILFLANIHSPLRPRGKADPSERIPCTWDSRVDPGRCEVSPAPPTSCRNSTASRPSSLVSTRDILTQVRKPPENFQLE